MEGVWGLTQPTRMCSQHAPLMSCQPLPNALLPPRPPQMEYASRCSVDKVLSSGRRNPKVRIVVIALRAPVCLFHCGLRCLGGAR